MGNSGPPTAKVRTMSESDLERAFKTARSMRDDHDWKNKSVVFHRQGSPYGELHFDEEDCREAGRLFLKLLRVLTQKGKE